MFCGFGAVVLLVLVINSNTKRERREDSEVLQMQVQQLAIELQTLEEHLAEIDAAANELNATVRDAAAAKQKVEQDIARVRSAIDALAGDDDADRKRIRKLEDELRSLELKQQRLAAEKSKPEAGRQVRQFIGEGNRQYLTGLKLGGKRVLILLDSSASMLGGNIVNIIRLRNLDDAVKKQAKKWQRSLLTLEWLLANVDPGSSVRVAAFHNTVIPLGGAGWVQATDKSAFDAIVMASRNFVPQGPTSLENICNFAAQLKPLPDNIILITDGLPTIAEKQGRKQKVSGDERVKLFKKAVARLPKNIPFNTVLLPLEGDPMAASLYWQLALDTRGSFFTPTSDWP